MQTSTLIVTGVATLVAVGGGELNNHPWLPKKGERKKFQPPSSWLIYVLFIDYSLYNQLAQCHNSAAELTRIDAFYFDYKRRNDPEFRKALKRDKKRHAKSQKAQAEAAHAEQRRLLVAAVRDAQMEGFPSDVEEKEAYFMNEVAQGEGLCQEGPEKSLDAALCFYKALKVYPQPKDLISIYDKTVPKHVLDILAEMIALDDSIPFSGSSVGSGAEHSTGVE
ncbi:mitochondrial import receptor subunit tom20 [Maublancomyces gigas]|uniref:Mitochondrial import receptor subunit tom20 n=1 Tax=Discina gigas TaxID=1032678 RepID=A0ABR3G8J6_9PEZI